MLTPARSGARGIFFLLNIEPSRGNRLSYLLTRILLEGVTPKCELSKVMKIATSHFFTIFSKMTFGNLTCTLFKIKYGQVLLLLTLKKANRHAQDMHNLFRAGANLKKTPEKDLFEYRNIPYSATHSFPPCMFVVQQVVNGHLQYHSSDTRNICLGHILQKISCVVQSLVILRLEPKRVP